MSVHRFYRADAPFSPLPASLPEGYSVRIWRPAEDGLPSAPVAKWPNTAWWAFDRARLFANRHAGVISIVHGNRLAHRSLVTPGWFRFPEMRDGDLQIGDTWTDPADRGRGLAGAAIAHVLEGWRGRFERMWYIVEDDNAASIRVIERCGFDLIGNGERTRPYGLSPLGQFRLSA